MKAVVFDLGNVLVDVDHNRGARELKARGVPAKMFDDEGVLRSLLHEYERGRLDRASFYRAVCGRTATVELEDFSAIYCDMFAPVQAMIDANAALRRSGFKTYIFSNTSELHFEHLRGRFSFMSAFDAFFLSYELGVMKPEPASYEAVERGTGCSGGEIVYLDDRIENVEGALTRGWTALHHRTPAGTLRRLRELALLRDVGWRPGP